MPVLLMESRPGLGEKGEVVQVAPGFFRNFLHPTKKALHATEEKLAEIRREEERQAARAQQKLMEAQKLASSFTFLKKFVIRRQAGPDEKIFGSVTEQDVLDVINELTNIPIEKKSIHLPPISKLGTYPVEVVLHPEVTAKFNLVVVKKVK